MSGLGFFLTKKEDTRTPLEIAFQTNDKEFLEAHYKKEDDEYEKIKEASLWDVLRYITTDSKEIPSLDKYDNYVMTKFLARNPKNMMLCNYLYMYCNKLDAKSHATICKVLADKSFYKYYVDEVSEKFKLDIKNNAYIELLCMVNGTSPNTSRQNLNELRMGNKLMSFEDKIRRLYPFSYIEEFIMGSGHNGANKELLLKEIRRILGES